MRDCARQSSTPRPGTCPTKRLSAQFVAAPAKKKGVNYEEITYEGYGPGGVALLIESVTDNRNRTVAEIRHAFSKNGGNLAAAGAVAWMFEKKGYIVVDKAAKSEDELFEIVTDAGAEDLRDDEDNFEIITAPADFDRVLEAVKKSGVEPQMAGSDLRTVIVDGQWRSQLTNDNHHSCGTDIKAPEKALSCCWIQDRAFGSLPRLRRQSGLKGIKTPSRSRALLNFQSATSDATREHWCSKESLKQRV